MGTQRITGEGRELPCGRCPHCGHKGEGIEKLANGRCYCRACGESWTPLGANYTIESDR